MGWPRITMLLALCAQAAYADPKPAARPTSGQPATGQPATGQAATDPAPLTRAPTVAPFLSVDLPASDVPSLRLEAIRIAGERAEADWRYPAPGDVFGVSNGIFYMGYFQYHPRTRRSAVLHGGAIGATLLGEILLGTGSPVAGVGALLTGATLDAAAADADRDAEAKRPRR